jgi:hypothetical protein
MTFRIETASNGQTKTIRLSGQIQSDDLQALNEEIRDSGAGTVLDLDDVTLVDVAAVRFFLACEAEGIQIFCAPPYIRNWIRREQDRQE